MSTLVLYGPGIHDTVRETLDEVAELIRAADRHPSFIELHKADTGATILVNVATLIRAV